jgi:hypothetical protein
MRRREPTFCPAIKRQHLRRIPKPHSATSLRHLDAEIAGFNEALRFADSRLVDKKDDLFFKRGVKEVKKFGTHDSDDLARNHRILID